MTGAEWITANAQYLAAEMDRLRLLLRRRLLWLRKHWQKGEALNRLGWAITDQEVELLLAGEDQRDEFEFYQSDQGAQGISADIDALDRRLHAARQEMEESGTAAPIDLLAMRFKLTEFERGVILLCLAPELDPAFERIYAYVQDDAARRFATPHLALALFGENSRETGRACFSPGAPLRRWRLVISEPAASSGLLGSALRVDERILQYLSGVNQLESRSTGLLAPAPKAPLPASHRGLAAKLAHRLNVEIHDSNIINIVGAADSGRLALARAACEYAGLGLLVLDPKLLPASGPERRESIALVEREAALLASGLFLDVDGLKQEEAPAFYASLDRVAGPLLIASRERLSWERDMLSVRITRPDSVSQAKLWSEVLGESGEELQGDIDAIVEQFDLGPSGIARAAALATNQASLRSPEEPLLAAEDLWQACRQQSSPQIEQLARKVEPCYTWADIVVPQQVLRQLHEITTQVANRPQVYQSWGFAKKLSRGRGISALFSGASGVGKTMAAEVLAHHLNLDLYRIDLAGVVSKYIGETEKNLRSVFDAAERSGAILFFDEADALFGKRSEVKDSHDRYANIEVNYLLQRMEDYRGLAILATNMRGTMDQAFLRRLRFIVDFPFPDAMQRTEIWRRVFPSEAPVAGLDFAALSRLEIPGGNIRNIAVNAAFLAASESSAITMDHVMRAACSEYTKIDRLILDTEFGRFSGAVAS